MINLNRVTNIIYHYGDSSVPPRFHRSYTINLSSNNINIKVDSYGDILINKNKKTTFNTFNRIKKSFSLFKINKEISLLENEPCTPGGTSEIITLLDKHKNRIFHASIYHCGKKPSGNLCGDIKGFSQEIQELVPKLKTYTNPFLHGEEK